MTAITTLRSTIATALTNATVWNTFSFPPQTIVANSVIVSPADPYVELSNNQYNQVGPLVNFKIIMTVPLLDNEGNLGGIETLLVAVFNKLSTSNLNFRIGSVSAPSVLSVASGDLLTCDLQVSILTTWS